MTESDRGRATFDIDDISDDDGLYHRPPSSPPSGLTRFTGPLINYVRNEWKSSAKYTQLPSASDRSGPPQWVQMITSIVTVPRFRRYAIVCLSFAIFCVLGWHYILSPRLEERSAILNSLDPMQEDVVGGWFGANALPQLEKVVQLRELNKTLLPAAIVPEDDMPSERRLIFIGDVHGCKSELENLLDKLSFNMTHDHLVFTGDLINKGPDSLGVVDLAREYNASCVRGNHEDRILTLRHDMLESNITDDSFNAKSRELALQLSTGQAEWLNACPVILNVGQITGMGQVVVVHGGLVPGVDLDRQDPYSVMNMRTVDLETHVPSSARDKGVNWTKLFNKHQSLALQSKNSLMTVVYGHDSKSGLSLKEYTKGLDSGCVKGGKLTALVVSDGGHQEIVQVKCSKHQKDKN